ncbi:hypothetical protein ONZ51_g11218 [Trametes cubensis]|uniref:F-box domain-containing protein n=1 Tax=Trametes cubensis TaxID=1111947 RepID=A0AAD7X487_9APHY|nr:hypothetical protein ONZ51_g11218 [Trametes cubensis]
MQIELIYDTVFSFLPPKDLVTFAKVSRALRSAVFDYFGHAYAPHRLLSRFVQDVDAFRNLQARTATLISGLAALDFFKRSSHLSDTLELYVHFIHRREVVLWFAQRGYQFLPSDTQSQDLEYTVTEGLVQLNDMSYGIAGTFLFSKDGSEAATVRIIVAARGPMEVILRFYSTCMLNVISYEKAYCIFPRATLHENCALRNRAPEGVYIYSKREVEKYESRGITMMDEVDPAEQTRSDSSSTFALGWRWIDDGASWVIKLDTQRITTLPTTNEVSTPLRYDPVTISGFSLRFDTTRKARLQYTIIDGPTTKYSYVLGDQDLIEQLIDAVFCRSPVWDDK